MKISLKETNNIYKGLSVGSKKGKNTGRAESSDTHKFDTVQVNSEAKADENRVVASNISYELRSQARMDDPAERIAELKQQIQSGTYNIDVHEISASILSFRG